MTEEKDLLFRLAPKEREQAKAVLWEAAESEALSCAACPLAATRKKVVFGDGDIRSKLFFIGEGPGADEDEQGLPFVGRAGQLLTQILEAAGISRKEVYITNVVKCRPPGNRVPTPEEALACNRLLETQIMLTSPKLIVLLGSTATNWILRTTGGITKLRGKWFEWRGAAVMPMFHPSYLLRNASSKEGSPKHLTWLDIQEVKRAWDSVKANGDLSAVKFGGD